MCTHGNSSIFLPIHCHSHTYHNYPIAVYHKTMHHRNGGWFPVTWSYFSTHPPTRFPRIPHIPHTSDSVRQYGLLCVS